MAPTKTTKTSPVKTKTPKTLQGEVASAPDSLRQTILTDYQQAVTAMQQGNYSVAHPAFEKLLAEAPIELKDRIRMYLAACIAQSVQGDRTFKNTEEQYDYAISLLNDGQYEDAREHLDEIVGGDANADYGFYGLAVLASMTGDAETCLDKLTEAIRLNPQNRFLARSDSDFQSVSDDPRFTELLYPDA